MSGEAENIERLPYIDSNFHFNRLCSEVKHKGDLNDLISDKIFENDKYLARAISNEVYLSHLRNDRWLLYIIDPMLAGTVGIHPKQVYGYTHDIRCKILSALDEPKIMGIGEIGLDFTANKCLWETPKKCLCGTNTTGCE